MSGNKRKGHRHPNSLAALKPAKPGEIRNPEGGRTHDPFKKELKKFTNKYLKEIIELAVMGNIASLQEVVKNPDTPAIQVGVAKALANAIQDGDWGTLENIISRIIGKVPERIHVGGDEEAPGITVSFVSAGKK